MVIEMKKVLWDLFNKTGNVNYYLLLRRMGSKNEIKNKRNSSK